MADAPRRIWRDMYADADPEGAARFGSYIEHIDGMPGGNDDKTRELLYVASLTALKAPAPLAVHIARATAAGASPAEIMQAISVASLLGGLPTLSAALAVYDEAFG